MRWPPHIWITPFIAAALLMAALRPAAAAPAPHDIVTTEADIAAAMYGDALAAGEALQRSVGAFLAAPDATTLDTARAAWLTARRPHAKAASLAFASPRTAQWERRVDAWPIEPGLIDYAASATGAAEDPLARTDVIASRTVRIGSRTVAADTIDRHLLETLQNAGGIPTNVAAGYHVIEFLLWGEDGRRPASDYATEGCTHGFCARRRAYLAAAADLLVVRLRTIAADWKDGGAARAALLAEPPAEGLGALLTAFGEQSFQGLAGERMKLSLVLHDAGSLEDRFSGAAAEEFVAAERGLAALYRGHYRRIDGTVVSGPSLAALAAAQAPDEAAAVAAAMTRAAASLAAIATAADGPGYAALIAPGNAAGSRLVMDGVHALVRQARAGERLAKALAIATSVEGGERLAGPAAQRR